MIHASKHVLLIILGLVNFISINQSLCQIKPATNSLFLYSRNDSIIDAYDAKTIKKARQHLNKKRTKGYLDCTLDSITTVGEKYKIHYTDGNRYSWGDIIIVPNTTKTIDNPKGKFSINELESFQNKIISSYRNNGYPNSKLVQKAQFENNFINITIEVDAGNFICYDSLLLDSSIRSSYAYIAPLTRIKYNNPFSLKTINSLKKTVNNSNLFEYQNHEISNFENKAKVYLILKENKTNLFTGYAGFQPDPENNMVITGEATLHLKNSFNYGENIYLNWKRVSNLSQYLNIDLGLPFLFQSPLGIIGSIKLDKQDSLFTNNSYSAGLSFYLANSGSLFANWQKINANQNKSDPHTTIQSKSQLYGIAYKIQNINNVLNPSKGYALETNYYVGNRRVNNYNNDVNNYLRFDYHANIALFFPIKNTTLVIKNKLWGIETDSIQQHEAIRKGGINTIRGFNENSIFSKRINIFSIEYRLLFDKYSNLYLLSDFAFSEDLEINEMKTNNRFSIGLGTNIYTKAGILALSYAVGKYNNKPFLINEGKIHIGYSIQF